jgi:hypothetical protein
MIARFAVLLPFDLFIIEGDNLPILDLSAPGYQIKFQPLSLYADRPSPTASVFGLLSSIQHARPASFTETVLVGGRRVATVNILVLDFIKPDFDRHPDATADPPPTFAFEMANALLARIRIHSRAFQIRSLQMDRDPWRISYLTDDGQPVTVEEGKIQGRGLSFVRVGVETVTAAAVEMAATQTAELHSWDQLLLDSYALLPDIGSAVVMASAALETYIQWALDVLHRERPLPTGLWEWINDRGFWIKEPSVEEQFDVLLRVFTGRSLKEETQLWDRFKELRKAKNALTHEGAAMLGGKLVDAGKAHELVDNADKIIKWVESLLPEGLKRTVAAAQGPFSRRLAAPEEGVAFNESVKAFKVMASNQNQGDIRVVRFERSAPNQQGSNLDEKPAKPVEEGDK